MSKLNLLLVFVLACVGQIFAQGQTGNVYPNGVEGIGAGSVPPPGVYLRLYTNYCQQTTMKQPDGTESPIGFNVSAFAVVPRLVWIADKKVLGANYGMEVLVPMVNTSLTIHAANIDQSGTSLGDVIFGPVLAWHGERYDLLTALDFFAPTGAWSADSKIKAGSDEWTFMPTGGFTFYFDHSKKWSGSVLARLELHKTKRHQDIKMGDDFHFEWGVGRALTNRLTVGPAGYAQWKISNDSGKDVTWDRTVKDRVFAIGPEIQIAFPKQAMFVSARGLVEFAAKGRGQGTAVWLTASHRF